jgi:hypothetical protein
VLWDSAVRPDASRTGVNPYQSKLKVDQRQVAWHRSTVLVPALLPSMSADFQEENMAEALIDKAQAAI